MWNTTFSRTLFPSTIIEWNKLDWKIKNSESIETLKKELPFIRPSPYTTFNCHNPKGIKILPWPSLDLNHLRECKFRHSFQDFVNPFYSCGKGKVESSSPYLLHCSNYLEKRLTLLSTTKNIVMSILQPSDLKFIRALLFVDTYSIFTLMQTFVDSWWISKHFKTFPDSVRTCML